MASGVLVRDSKCSIFHIKKNKSFQIRHQVVRVDAEIDTRLVVGMTSHCERPANYVVTNQARKLVWRQAASVTCHISCGPEWVSFLMRFRPPA